MTVQTNKNLYTYLVFLLIAAIGIAYGNQINSEFGNLRIWSPFDILIMLIGVPFLFFQTKSGLPEFWETKVSNSKRFVIPLLVGLGFGILDIFVFKVILHPEPYKELPPFLQPFPYSIFLYFSGAFEVEVFYRLIPITIICLLGNVFQKGRYAELFFWVAALLTACREPLEQMPDGNSWLLVYSLLSGFLMNLIQAIWYKRAGFISALAVRLGHYLLWHILLGVYVQFVDLS